MILLDCNSVALSSILNILKNILNLIWIIGPILAIISLAINITMLVKDPDDKKIPKKIKNSILALMILFLVPTIVNAAMYMLDDKTNFSACWNTKTAPINTNPTYIDPYDRDKSTVVSGDSTAYEAGEKRVENSTSSDVVATVTSCGNLEYCNKFLTIMYNNSKKFNDAIINNNASVTYSNSGSPSSWGDAIKQAEAGKTIRIACHRPTHWGVQEIVGESQSFCSIHLGGFGSYKGKFTEYTKQIKFDGSKNVRDAIKEGLIQPGDIVGVKSHTFSIYSVNQSDGSAVVFDGGHMFTNKCQKSKKCSPMFTYSAGTNASMKLYQILRWIK